MKAKELKKYFLKAKLEGKDLAIESTSYGKKNTEIVIIRFSNLDYKLKYYINSYDEFLVNNKCRYIKIINAYTLNFNDIVKREGRKRK